MLKLIKELIKVPWQLQAMERRILAATYFQPLISQFQSYIPFNGSALDLRAIQLICNDILINQRKVIVELGGGISTMIISKFIQTNKLDCELITIEQDRDWMQKLNEILDAESLSKYTDVVMAPVVNMWYDKEALEDKLHLKKIDSLIIDGPKAELELNRYDAIDFFNDKLSAECIIFIDDIDRKDEYKLFLDWARKMNVRKLTDANIGVLIRGKKFNIF